MRRLVYAPNIQAFIKTDSGVVDISPYLVSGTLDRKVNQVSGAQLTFRNPVYDSGPNQGKMLFTAKPDDPTGAGAAFHPMDPIIIVMQRLAGHPVQVFAGYIDKSPYLQLYPGLCSIEASCTLKRLLYTQWDAALPFVKNFLEQYGWVLTSDSGIANPSAEEQKLKAEAGKLKGQFNDGSIGALLFAVLNQAGDWDPSNIWIEALPSQIADIVTNLYNQIRTEVKQGDDLFKSLLTQIIGTQSQGTGGTASVTLGSGPAWKVVASGESDPPGSTASCGPLPADRRGYSVLSQSGLPTDSATAGQALSPGSIWPCSVDMIITNPANGKSVVAHHVDNGGGSSFRPVIGIYPQTEAELGLSGGQYEVIIQRADGKDFTPVTGTKINPSSTSTSSVPSKQNQKNPTSGTNKRGGIAPTHSAMQPVVTANAAKAGSSPGGKTGSSTSTTPSSSTANAYSAPLPNASQSDLARTDEGVDFLGANGAPILAIGNGAVTEQIQFDGPGVVYSLADGDHAGMEIYVAEGITLAPGLTIGSKVSAGKPVAYFSQANSPCSSPCIEMGFWQNGRPYHNTDAVDHQPYSTSGGRDGRPTVGGWEFTNFLNSIGQKTLQKAPPGFGGGSASGGASSSSGGSSGGSVNGIADAFSTLINLPSIFDSAEALAFTGKRSFMADQPLFPFVEQLCQASLRSFMSMPNGNFFAFFPDYFGLFGRKYYWEVRDIEIIDGRIDLTDDPLITHLAVAGDVTQYHGTIDVFDLVLTAGIFDIFDAFATNYINGPDSLINANPQTPANNKAANKKTAAADKSKALAFLRRYGARPYVEEAPMIRSPVFELFLAFQKFMLLWSKQFQTTFELTFMPEIFPGGLIGLPDHHLQLYVEEVSHSFDYEQGFTTTIHVSSPSAFDGQSNPTLRHGLARPAILATSKSK